ncbi:MAG TPA: hypothetical protein VEA69_16215 [Tepidisphaeraceae bacterium]|nr:hypothetical protein [Tepidisphaeraceae bacterium]
MLQAAPRTSIARRTYASLYNRLRGAMSRHDWLAHALRVVRFGAVAGPLRPALIKFCRGRSRNEPVPVRPDSIFRDFDPAAAAASLRAEGYARGLLLPPELVDRLAGHFGPVRSHVLTNPHNDCPAVLEVAHDPGLVDVARRYLGAEPILYGTHIWGTPAGTASAHGSRFHFDVPDVKSMVAFFYLCDVDRQATPHVVVRGTHDRKTFRQMLRIYLPDDEARRSYGDRVTVITGPRGTGFCEEQTIFHKALSGSTKPRVILAVTYTLRRRPPRSGAVARP